MKNVYNSLEYNSLHQVDKDKISNEMKMAVILGNEGNGISKEVDNLLLDNIYIPMNNTESLNVAIAGSIIMYELKD